MKFPAQKQGLSDSRGIDDELKLIDNYLIQIKMLY